jgi:hypothetical protein
LRIEQCRRETERSLIGQRIGMIPADGDLLARQREGAPFDRAADADQAGIVRLFQTL